MELFLIPVGSMVRLANGFAGLLTEIDQDLGRAYLTLHAETKQARKEWVENQDALILRLPVSTEELRKVLAPAILMNQAETKVDYGTRFQESEILLAMQNDDSATSLAYLEELTAWQLGKFHNVVRKLDVFLQIIECPLSVAYNAKSGTWFLEQGHALYSRALACGLDRVPANIWNSQFRGILVLQTMELEQVHA